VPRIELEPTLLAGRKHGSAVLPVHVDLLQANCEIQPPSVTVTW
jgi:hypothetical protein